MKCSICGGDFTENKYGIDACSAECLKEKTWRMIEELQEKNRPYIIVSGELYMPGRNAWTVRPVDELDFYNIERNVRRNDTGESFTISSLEGLKIPDNHRKILHDNAVIIDRAPVPESIDFSKFGIDVT